MRRLGLRPRDSQDEMNEIRLHAARAALRRLDNRAELSETGHASQFVRGLYEARIRRLQAVAADDE